MNRCYSAGFGKSLTVGPDLDGGYLGDLTSLNRFAYGSGDPVNANDPDGTCTVVFTGSAQAPDDKSTITGEPEVLGADSAYGYPGLNKPESVTSVILHSSDAIQTALSALQCALSTNTGSIDVLAYSGGASDYTLAFNLLTQSQKDRIGTILYISPGMAGIIASQNPPLPPR